MLPEKRRIIIIVAIGIVLLVLTKFSIYGFRPSHITHLKLTEGQMMTTQRLKNTVTHLSDKIGNRNYVNYQNLQEAAQYIIGTFEGLGYEIEIMEYAIDKIIYQNIIARSPKKPKNQESIIVCAHYDTCFNPGADDNASSVAAMLELARLLRNEKLKTPIEFIAFVNEEPPFFMTKDMGSFVYADRMKKQQKKIKAVINLEMVGYYSDEKHSKRYLPFMGFFYPNRGNFIALVGNFKSRHIMSNVKKAFKENSEFPIESVIAPSRMPAINWGDHWSFWMHQYPAIMVTDTAFLRNPNYHQPTDLPETLDYEKMTAVVFGLESAIIALSNK